MKQAKIKFSTLDKIFNFLEKERGEEVPSPIKYLTEEIKFEIAKENLSVTKFQNGDPIPEAKTPEEWKMFRKKEVPAFMRNGNDFHYNYFAVMDERDICPAGWRVPTKDELNFIRYKKLYKNFPSAGCRFVNGSVDDAGSIGYYWSSTVAGSDVGTLVFHSRGAFVGSFGRAYGFSVRCVRDK